MQSLPKYISPVERPDPVSYTAHVKQYNEAFQLVISEPLQEIVRWRNLSCALFATGSDGRLEKGPVSGLEFVLLRKPTSPSDQIADLVAMLATFRPRYNIEENVEVKDVFNDVMSVYDGDFERVYPMRVLDLAHLAGDPVLLERAKWKLVREWVGPDGSKIAGKVKDKKKEYRNAFLTGVQRYTATHTLRHFDLAEGVAYYSPEQRVQGFKMGPLRYVQFVVMHDLIKYYRKLSVPLEEKLIQDLPANTEDRILALEVRNLLRLSPLETSDLINSYKFFLWLYHKAQEAHRRDGTTETVFDIAQVAERTRDLSKILQEGVLQEIPDQARNTSHSRSH